MLTSKAAGPLTFALSVCSAFVSRCWPSGASHTLVTAWLAVSRLAAVVLGKRARPARRRRQATPQLTAVIMTLKKQTKKEAVAQGCA